MRATMGGGGGLSISGLDMFLAGLLRVAPLAAASNGAAAAQRLFPDPTSNNKTKNEEWSELVVPDLAAHFLASRGVVEADLAALGAPDADPPECLEIPAAHFDSWLNCLNQARLALAANFALDEDDIASVVEGFPDSPRSMALVQIHFYGFLQECLIRVLEGAGPMGDGDLGPGE